MIASTRSTPSPSSDFRARRASASLHAPDSFATRLASFALLALALLFASCAGLRSSDDDPASDEVRDAELGDMESVSVCGDVWLGEDPSPEHLDIANRRGIRTVISLLPPDAPSNRGVGRECTRLGMSFVPVGVSGELPTDAEVDRALAALASPDRGPALLYCESGARTAMIFAIYRVAIEGVPVETALQAARRIGMKPGLPEEAVRLQVDRLLGRTPPLPRSGDA